MDYKTADVSALAEQLKTLTEELRSARFKESGAHTRNMRAARTMRRNIARIHTVLTQRQLAK
jgi:ribosomal protein L29